MKNINKLIDNFSQVKALVIGDYMLDEYVWGKVERISPEAPVPVVKIQSRTTTPGGSANVVNNIRSLGGTVYACGVTGRDNEGNDLLKKLKHERVNIDGIFTDEKRVTTQKVRIMAQRYQMLRVDSEDTSPISDALFKRMTSHIEKVMSKVDFVIIEDYGKGVVTDEMVVSVLKTAKTHKKMVAVDPKEKHFSLYRGIDLITPNVHELAHATGQEITDKASTEKAARALQKQLNCSMVLVTQGELGMTLFEKGKKPFYVPANAREVFDVSGAGDTVIGVFCLVLAAGGDVESATRLSNLAAGIVVGKLGVAVATRDELLRRVEESL